MNGVQTESLLQLFKAVGQPERVKILELSARLLKHVGNIFWRPEVQ